MFVASTIQFKSLGAQRKLQTYGAGRFKAAIFILDRLRVYWDSLEGLVGLYHLLNLTYSWLTICQISGPA